MNEDPPPVCPSGIAPARVLGFGLDDDPGEIEEHITSCVVCAEMYFDLVEIRDAARGLAAREAAKTPDRSWLRVLSGARRLPLAAALLVAVSSLATAAVFLLWSPRIVATGGGGVGSVADVAARTGFDFAAAGIPRGTVERWIPVTVSPDEAGSVAVVRIDDERRHDITAFGADGRHLWTASRAWDDYDRVLGDRSLTFALGHALITERTAERTTERVCVVFVRVESSAVFLIDPATGRRDGTHFHSGPLALETRKSSGVSVIPGPDGAERRLLVLGQHRDGDRAAACATVLDIRGRELQHVELPGLGLPQPEGPRTFSSEVDWRPGRHAVWLETTDSMLVWMPIVNGRLDVDRAELTEPDSLGPTFDAWYGEGAFERRYPAGAARDAFLAELKRGIRETPPERRTSWDLE